MTDIGEMILKPVGHEEPSPDCPFCPKPEPSKYKTYPGDDNNSEKLAKIMEKPSKLTSLQRGARPQTGRADADGYTQEQEPPEPRLKDDSTFYTFQAHHLISGKQALKGSPMEQWIVASSVNKADTGYSVNCAGNGFWAPSVPKEYVGKWGPEQKVLTDEQRQIEAEKVMLDSGAQIHIGPHNISDPDDPKGEKHESYDHYIKEKLSGICRRITQWQNYCPLCETGKNEKPQTNYMVHDVLDRLSNHLQRKITAPVPDWDIFLSKYALEFHKPVCQHDERVDL